MIISDVIKNLEDIAPPALADDGDRIGLQVGDAGGSVTRVVVAVDPSPKVVEYAAQTGAELIVTHHPLIYTPLDTLAAGEPIRDTVIKLISSRTALYVMHTNLDIVSGGVNDVLAETIGVRETSVLSVVRKEKMMKLVVFVPDESVDAVFDAMAEAGAGFIGNYSHCGFRTRGKGSFLPLGEAKPYIGEVGRLEEVDEFRLETIAPEWICGKVIEAMLRAHPYEEAAYDVYPLENEPRGYGYGRVGKLDRTLSLGDYRKMVEESLDYGETRMTGDPARLIQKVALSSGSGGKLIPEAHAAGADVYVCGDLKHHDMLYADALGLAVIDAGHYATERPGVEALAERLKRIHEGILSVEFRL